MNIYLSEVYRILRDTIVTNNIPDYDMTDIENEILGVDEEVLMDKSLFETRFTHLMATSTSDATAICESLALFRISAMNISTVLSNLAASISTVIVAVDNRHNASCENIMPQPRETDY